MSGFWNSVLDKILVLAGIWLVLYVLGALRQLAIRVEKLEKECVRNGDAQKEQLAKNTLNAFLGANIFK